MHSSAPDPLTALLRRADPAATPGEDVAGGVAFTAGVHRRIRAAAETAPRPGSMVAFPAWIARHAMPLAAALALLLALAAGGGLAYTREQKLHSEAYAAAYARSIDPWLMHAARGVAPLAAASGAVSHSTHR